MNKKVSCNTVRRRSDQAPVTYPQSTAGQQGSSRCLRRGAMQRLLPAVLVAALSAVAPDRAVAADEEWRSMGDVLAASAAGDWRDVAPENTLYLELNHGTVVIEVAPQFAPAHVLNLRRLVDVQHFAAGAIIRSQDNYVVQWSGNGATGDAAESLAPEFYRDAAGLSFTPLQSRDAYAPEVGFVDGFPAARDAANGRAWLAHCYGMLGVGRGNAPDSGNASELYVVTGHAPRHLDRNVTLIGRVLDGIEHLSSLPRGGGPLGFYEEESGHVPIRSLRFGTDYDPGWQVLRTDTPVFGDLVQSRRYRNEDWFVDPAGHIGLCNVPLPVRRVN